MTARREILEVKNSFNGTFTAGSQTNLVPASLTTLLDMITRDPTIKRDPLKNQACLSVAQLLVFTAKVDFETNQTMHLVPLTTLTM